MVRPVRVVVAPIRSTTTWWLVSGRPRQLLVIAENSRCSIWGEIPTLAGGFGRAGLGTDPRAAWVGVPSGSAARVLGGGRGRDVYGVAELLELVEEPPGFALGVAAAPQPARATRLHRRHPDHARRLE